MNSFRNSLKHLDLGLQPCFFSTQSTDVCDLCTWRLWDPISGAAVCRFKM